MELSSFSGVRSTLVLLMAMLVCPASGWAQEATGEKLGLAEFRPQSMLKLQQQGADRARYPVVDVHTHFGYRLKNSRQRLHEFIEVMDRNNIAICVSLDGLLLDRFIEHKHFLEQKHVKWI